MIRITLMLILIHLFTEMRIRILLLIKMLRICCYWFFRPLMGSILSLQASIVSVYGPPRLCFEPLKLLNCDFDADPPDPIFAIMRIRIQLPTNNTDPDPDPQPW
jgi:hypothetical protein